MTTIYNKSECNTNVEALRTYYHYHVKYNQWQTFGFICKLSRLTRSIKAIWENKIYINGTKTNARGVTILINDTFEYSVQKIEKDAEGNLIMIDLKVANFSIRLINIYAPNTDSPHFFQNVREKIANSDQDYLIVCGDFNIVINPNMDSSNYNNTNNPNARKILLDTINEQKLKS